MLVHNFLERNASRYPDKVALIHEDIRASYAEINSASNRMATWLTDKGMKAGERILILMDNSLEYIISYYGVLKAGAVAVPVSTDIKNDGLAHIIKEIDPYAVISSRKFIRVISAIDPDLLNPAKFLILNYSSGLRNDDVTEFNEVLSENADTNPNIDIETTSLCGIVYTSGSMGEPKGVMLSHDNIVANTMSICKSLDIHKNDIQMVVLPFFYVMGKSLLNTHFASGATIVINNKFAFPASVLKEMVDLEVTSFSGVPSTYAYLLHRSPLAKYKDKLRSLRYCSQAGGHMAVAIKEQLKRALPDHTKIYIMYGATEASARLSCLSAERFGDKIESIGKPIDGVKLRIVNGNGEDTAVGELGELVAEGKNIMMGYWKDKNGTSRVLDHNGYHTGDMGWRDDEGFLYLQGRKDQLIKVGGHRINPSEIEEAIMSSNLVVETFVVGLPDKLLGNKVVAIVSTKDDTISIQDLLRSCAEKLPKYKMPSEIKTLKSLPKKANGKIDRKKCCEAIYT